MKAIGGRLNVGLALVLRTGGRKAGTILNNSVGGQYWVSTTHRQPKTHTNTEKGWTEDKSSTWSFIFRLRMILNHSLSTPGLVTSPALITSHPYATSAANDDASIDEIS